MASIFTGCDLDEEVFTEIVSSEFGETEEEVASLVGAAYASYSGWIGGPWTAAVISSDAGIVPTRGTDWGANGLWDRVHRHEFLDTDPPVTSDVWNTLYQGINNVNRIIFQLEGIGTEASLQTVKELRVLRAINYYWLVDFFGNVPLVTSFSDAEESPSNNSRAEVFAYVISETEAVINDLPTDISSTYGKINKWVAHALLAKVYLNAEVYTGTAQWNKAKENSDAIINSGNYSLATDFFDNFSVDNENSPENIFVFVYDQIFSSGNQIAIRTLHYQHQQTYNFTQQPWNGYSSLEEFYNTFEDDDVRKRSFLVGPQFDSSGNPLIDPAAEATDPDGPEINITTHIDDLQAALRQQGARINKFEFEIGGNPGNMNNDYPLFRYGDIMLTKAEAEFRLGNEGAALILIKYT